MIFKIVYGLSSMLDKGRDPLGRGRPDPEPAVPLRQLCQEIASMHANAISACIAGILNSRESGAVRAQKKFGRGLAPRPDAN